MRKKIQQKEVAGGLYHVMNRGNRGATIFHEDDDYAGFEQVLAENLERYDVKLYAYQLLPNHWHMVLSPNQVGQLCLFMRGVTTMHSVRYRVKNQTQGHGHVYQGSFKRFLIQDDAHFLTVCRYVEQNAMRLKLVRSPDKWRWGSLWRWLQKTEPAPSLLSRWPISRQAGWAEKVKAKLSPLELETIRNCIRRSCPFGGSDWVEATVEELGLQSTVRPWGRPKTIAVTAGKKP